ncbi:hypothetical protein H4W33_008968 [Kibdelosporangium phytohabitans]|nr:hypothetical protein [Kibdelosporangium phytohabitans]
MLLMLVVDRGVGAAVHDAVAAAVGDVAEFLDVTFS